MPIMARVGIEGLLERLIRGKFVIKEGHNVAELNPDGERVEVELGSTQVKNRLLEVKLAIDAKELSEDDSRVEALRKKYGDSYSLYFGK